MISHAPKTAKKMGLVMANSWESERFYLQTFFFVKTGSKQGQLHHQLVTVLTVGTQRTVRSWCQERALTESASLHVRRLTALPHMSGSNEGSHTCTEPSLLLKTKELSYDFHCHKNCRRIQRNGHTGCNISSSNLAISTAREPCPDQEKNVNAYYL